MVFLANATLSMLPELSEQVDDSHIVAKDTQKENIHCVHIVACMKTSECPGLTPVKLLD